MILEKPHHSCLCLRFHLRSPLSAWFLYSSTVRSSYSVVARAAERHTVPQPPTALQDTWISHRYWHKNSPDPLSSEEGRGPATHVYPGSLLTAATGRVHRSSLHYPHNFFQSEAEATSTRPARETRVSRAPPSRTPPERAGGEGT